MIIYIELFHAEREWTADIIQQSEQNQLSENVYCILICFVFE